MAGEDLLGKPPPDGITYDRTAWGGQGYDLKGGRYQLGTSGADQDVNRYRDMAYGAGTRSFAPLNYGSANSLVGTQNGVYGSALQQAQSGYGMRDQQADATGLMRDAAYGNTPSQAEIVGKQAMQQGLQNRLAAAAAARGGVESQASAMRQAQAGGAAYEQNALQSIAAARAAEMAQARQAYGQQLAQVRGQDYAGAGLMGQLGAHQAQQAQAQGAYDMQGNALNQQAQMGYENLAFDTRKAQQQGGQFQAALEQGAYDAAQQRQEQGKDRFQRYLGSAMSFGGGLLGGLVGSDNRMKVAAQPSRVAAAMAGAADGMMSAGAQLSGGAKPNGSFLDAYMKTLQQHGTDDQKRAATPPPASGIIRENPYGGRSVEDDAQGYDGGINRVDPYGSGEYTISDDAAKREADKQIRSYRKSIDDGPSVRRVSSGTPESGYNTELTRGAEAAYIRKFGTRSDADYDLRGAYAAGLTDGAKSVPNDEGGWYFPNHLPDTYKKPNHETFSDESQYARYAPGEAGHWSGDRYRPGPSRMLSDDAAKREAFWAGATYGMNPQRDVNPATGQPRLPDYARKQEAPDKARPASAGAGPTYGEWSKKHPPKNEAAPAPKPASAPLPGPKPQAALQQDANRAGTGFTYAYKDQFAPPTQAPGEVNYGPSAQQLAANPLTATAVKQTPDGLLAIDKEKLLKSNTAGIASLQEQIDELRGGYRG